MRGIARLIALNVLFLTVISCGPAEESSETPEVDTLATAVGGTLTAAAPTELSVPLAATATASPPTSTPIPPPTQPPPVLRIAYTDDGNAWLWQEGQPLTQLTTSGGVEQVLISSDGAKVAFTRREALGESPAEIRSVNSDGSGETVLLTAAQFDALYPLGDFLHNDYANLAFIPGTHKLMLNTRAISLGPGLLKYDDLLVLDADTGSLTTVFPPGEGGDFLVSPDGLQVAIIRPTSISLANIDGSNLQRDLVTYTPVITYSEFQYYAQPRWASDSSELAVAIPSEDILAPDARGTIWRIPTDGSPAASLSTIEGDFYFTQFGSGGSAISPDLTQVAFLRDTTSPGVKALLLSDLQGSAERTYISGALSWLGWSPDGRHFIFSIGAAPDLSLGAVDNVAVSIGPGTQVEWIDNNSYLFLSGSRGAWTINRGEIGELPTPLLSTGGDFVGYDSVK